MLSKDGMQKIAENFQCLDNNNKLQNMQSINENLLRMAVKYTDNYATDILIFIDNILKYFNSVDETDLYFRMFGVEWENSDGFQCMEKMPEYYRHSAKLVYNRKKETITLYDGIGNV